MVLNWSRWFKMFFSQNLNGPFRLSSLGPALVVGLLLGSGLACAVPGLGGEPAEPVVKSGGPTVKISSPTPGQTLELGQPVRVGSISSDAEGIARIELLVNNTIVRTDANPQTEANGTFVAIQPWLPETPGPAVIQVRAYSLANTVGQSELVTVEVVVPAATEASPSPPLQPTVGIGVSPATPTPLPGLNLTPVPTPVIACVPPSCQAGEVYYCPDNCPGGCGAQCATPTVPPLPEPTATPPGTAAAALTITEIIIDNSSPEFRTSGQWFIGDGGQSYNGNCAWAPRGVANNASWTPVLPVAGSYEVLAWWCGDPNHDQSSQANYFIETAQGEQRVQVNLQEQAGQWHSLGRYVFKAGDTGLVNLNGGYDGNVIADAVKFVFLAAEPLPTVVPTPLPPRSLVASDLPSQLQQATSADLAVRLNLTGATPYFYAPIIKSEEVTFDDCQAFPGDGCGGSRPGWQVQVEYLDQSGSMIVTYRVSNDYSLVSLAAPAELAGRQRVFLTGDDGRDISFEVDRAPQDRTWRLFIHSAQRSFNPTLPADLFAPLEELSQRYSSVRLNLPGGGVLQLYGLGERPRLSGEDQVKLEDFGRTLLQQIP